MTSTSEDTTSNCSTSTDASEDGVAVRTHFMVDHYADDSDDENPPPRTSVIEKALVANKRISDLLRRLRAPEEPESDLENKITSRISLLNSIRSSIRHDLEADIQISDDEYYRWLERKNLAKRVIFIPTTPEPENKNYLLKPDKDTAVQVSSDRLKVSLNNVLSEKKLLVDDAEFEDWLQKNFPQYAEIILTSKRSTEVSSDVSIKPDFTTPSIIKLKKELNELSFDAQFKLKPMEYTKWSDFSIVSKTKDQKNSIKKENKKDVISNKFFSIHTLKYCYGILTSLELWSFIFMVIFFMYYSK